MDTLPGLSIPLPHVRTSSGNHSTLSRLESERDIAHGGNGTSPKFVESNRSSTTLPKAFSGMLKTTTETGEIGMFSIRPSRVPTSLNSPRRLTAYNNGLQSANQGFQPYGVPPIDDRRRLPSYARDATSELISMYETSSQKSSRVFDEPDCRSYSMTQASSYSLSNHRSYTSLRSQPEGNVLQRPRSPFAYPTRLKRPGFRPSSPALTDGGVIDYSRRAEIDRMPYGYNHGRASPSSLYAQKRKPPPLSLRPEGNRSTPSLLSQPSPSRRSSSPLVTPSHGGQGQEWTRRNGIASGNTSPARSTLSLASTVNILSMNLPPSTATTPGKIPPPSPLYYDYTEEFEVENYCQPIAREPPPQFRIDRTIPEDRPMSTVQVDGPSTGNFSGRNTSTSLNKGIWVSSPPASFHQLPIEESRFPHADGANEPPSWPVRKTSLGALDHNAQSAAGQNIPQNEKKAFRLSGLGYGARELNNHVEEAFGLVSSPSFELLDTKNVKEPAIRQEIPSGKATEDGTKKKNPEVKLSSPTVSDNSIHLATLTENTTNGEPQDKRKEKRSSSLDFTSARQKRTRSSGFNSLDTGFAELAELITTLENANRTRNCNEKQGVAIIPQGRTRMASPTLVDHPIVQRSSSDHSNTPPLSSLNPQRNESTQMSTQLHQLHRNLFHQRPQKMELVRGQVSSAVPNFSHQIPRKSVSRSGSPMLAPKPISPARQLKLKNSVPQLMKALPQLPPEPTICAVSPPDHVASWETGLPCRFSPLLPESKSNWMKDVPPTPELTQSDKVECNVGREGAMSEGTSNSRSPVSTVRNAPQEHSGSSPPLGLPRLKLKMRSSNALRPHSRLESRPWNSEENYPWANEILNVCLPVGTQSNTQETSKPPKFRLKITHSSDSTQGTVLVKRESGDSKPHFRNPTDLFTPPTGIDNIFRQVSRHLYTRKSSASSSHPGRENTASPISQTQVSAEEDVGLPPSHLTANQVNPSDVRSFFSVDSSNAQGRHSLRKRISNLKARIAVPYASKGATQLHDDVTWNGRIHSEAEGPSVTRSVPNLRVSGMNTDEPILTQPTERAQRITLRDKLSRWLRGARSAIKARVKSRKVDES